MVGEIKKQKYLPERDLEVRSDLPWRFLMAVVAAIAYVVLNRFRQHRRASVYDLRGV